MPADINSYALSLEFTLQSNAEEVLRGVSNEITSIENKVQNLVANIANVMDSAGAKISEMSKEMSSAMTATSAATSDAVVQTVALEEAAVGAADAASEAADQAAKIGESLKLPDAMMDQLRKAMAAVQDLEFLGGEGENAEKAADAFRFLTDQALPNLEKQRISMAAKGQELGEEEVAMIEYIKLAQKKAQKEQDSADEKYRKLKRKWDREAGKNFDKEILDRKQIKKLTDEQRKLYQEYTDAMEERLAIQEALADAEQLPQIRAQKQAVQASGELAEGVGKAANKMQLLGQAVKGVTGAISNMMKTIGLGELAQAASLTGLYGVAVNQAAKEEERFHTINFRNIGTMRQLQSEVAAIASTFPALREELIEARALLREMGTARDDILKLETSVATLNRTTGAGMADLAKFSKIMTTVTGSAGKAQQQLFLMQRAAKEMALTGKDLDWVLRQSSEAAFIMGARGEEFAERYNRALLRTAGAAKNLGLSVDEAGSYINKLKDPLGFIEILGREAFNMDPEQKMEAVGERAEQMLADITNAADLHQDNMEKIRIASILGIQADQVEKQLRLMVEAAAEGGEYLTKEVMDPQQEMMKTMSEAAGLQRDTMVTVSKTLSQIQQDLEPILKLMSSIFKAINESGIGPTILKIGVYVGALVTTVGGLAGTIGAIKAWRVAWAMAGQTVGQVATQTAAQVGGTQTAMRALGSTTANVATQSGTALRAGFLSGGKAALFMGKGIAVAAAAYAGWKIGRFTDELLGLGDSFERVAEGNASWWDYVKAANPMGLLVVGYRKAADALNDYNLRQERAAQLATKMRLEKEGLLAPLTDIDKKILDISRKHAELAKGDEKQRKEAEKLAIQQGELMDLRDAMAKHANKDMAEAAKAFEKDAVKRAKFEKMREKEAGEQAALKTLQRHRGLLAKYGQDTDEVTKKIEAKEKAIKKVREEVKALMNEGKKQGKAEKDAATEGMKVSKAKAAEYLKQIQTQKKGTIEYNNLMVEVSDKLGVMPSLVETKLQDIAAAAEEPTKKLGDGLKKAVDGVQKEMKDTEVAVVPKPKTDTEVAAAEKVAAAETKSTAELERATTAVTTVEKKAIAEPITTAKIEEETGKPSPVENDQLVQTMRQGNTLEELSRKLDAVGAGNLDRLVSLLNEYLPKIADRDTGLASSANQWYPS